MLHVIPLEVKVRELIPKAFLAYKILSNRKDAEVIIGPQRLLFNRINTFKNAIYFEKNTYHKRLGINFNLKDNYLCMLDEEGPIHLFDDTGMKFRYSIEKINKIDKFYFWGKKDIKKLPLQYLKQKKKIQISGHPKFDILKKPYNKIFSNELSYIKKKYGKYVLFVSSFEDDSDTAIARNTSIIKELNKNKKNKYIKRKIEMKKYVDANSKNYKITIEMLKKLAKENPNLNFIFRKHPHENENEILKKFGSIPKNLFLEYKFQVSSWIIGSSIYIHSGCTTSFEAACCNKNIVCFIPNNNFQRYETFKKFGKFFSQKRQCIDYVNKLIKNIGSIKDVNYRQLYPLIYNLEKKKLFFKIFLRDINKLKNDKKSEAIFTEIYDTPLSKIIYSIKKPILSILSFIKNHIFLNSFFMKFLPEKHLYSKKDAIRKFDKLEKKDLSKILKKFLIIENKKNIKIAINQISDSVFCIKNH